MTKLHRTSFLRLARLATASYRSLALGKGLTLSAVTPRAVNVAALIISERDARIRMTGMTDGEAMRAHKYPSKLGQVSAQLRTLRKLGLPAIMQEEVGGIANFNNMDRYSGVSAKVHGQRREVAARILYEDIIWPRTLQRYRQNCSWKGAALLMTLSINEHALHSCQACHCGPLPVAERIAYI